MTRRIAVFTATRADLWPLSPVLRALHAEPRVELVVLAAGAHLSDRYGRTLREIDLGADVVHALETGVGEDDTADANVAVVARTAETVSRALVEHGPDLLVVLGDRTELLGVATAATLHRVPLVHLHGGEVTEGAIDDSVRHAVTKLAHVHCCACEEYAARVRRLGEEAWRVHVTGEPTIDRLLHDAHPPAGALACRLGIDLRHPFALLTYHPPTLHPERLDAELDALLGACEAFETVVATYPGADPGAARIITRLREWERTRENVVVVESLGKLYPTALAAADVMLGNSSSGIVEAMSFALPVVNVGDRQRGRVRGPNVVDVAGHGAAVRAATARALDPSFRASLRGLPNPYGDGKAASRVVDVLLGLDLDGLLHKKFVDAGGSSSSERAGRRAEAWPGERRASASRVSRASSERDHGEYPAPKAQRAGTS